MNKKDNFKIEFIMYRFNFLFNLIFLYRRFNFTINILLLKLVIINIKIYVIPSSKIVHQYLKINFIYK